MASVEIRAFVFTDIVGSTRLKKQMPGRDNAERNQYFAEEILRPHRQLIEAGLAAYEGRVISTQGDGHFLEFRSPIQAVMWAIDVQQVHAGQPIATPEDGRLGVKIGIHMGPASADPNQTGNYIGTSVDYAARLVQLATEGKIIVSEVVATFVREEDIADIHLHEHGLQELAGIGPKLVFEVVYGDLQPGPLKPAGGSSAPPVIDSSSGSGLQADVTTLQEPTTGVRIKDYELLEEIAEGGMGKVFKARHVGMGRVCVLKLIKDSLLGAGNEEILERFYREIQVVARLKHPNIIQAYHSSSRGDDYHFLVMEYVDGLTLDRLIDERGAVPLGKGCEIVRQAAHGLQCIHDHGLVHRDIKPSNLMITQEAGREVVKILDLGLALLIDDNSERITQYHQRAMGTAYYMAPEQWASSSVDIRADIYSLGCTFYHLVAGRPPFQDSKFSQEHAHRSVMPPPPTGDAELPEPLWRIVEMMMAKRPEERFAEPLALCKALDDFTDASTVPPAVATRREHPPPRPSSSLDARRRPGDETWATSATDTLTADAGGPQQRGPLGSWVPWVVILLGLLLAVLAVGRLAGGSRRAIDSPAHATAARHFLLTLPGMNGEWWFDEIPWFFPEIRNHLLQHISVAQFTQLRAMARQPDVPAFYDRLRGLCESSLNADA
ncbi:MAG: protein kinase, partial [Planctomycetota bacterium]|nr:protein kinase [Planctomycetota bacterium]